MFNKIDASLGPFIKGNNVRPGFRGEDDEAIGVYNPTKGIADKAAEATGTAANFCFFNRAAVEAKAMGDALFDGGEFDTVGGDGESPSAEDASLLFLVV